MRWSDCQASDVSWAVCPNAKRFRGFRPPSGSALGGPGSAHRAGWFRGEFDMPLPGAAKTIQPGFAQGAADWRSGPRRSILSVLCPVHPFPLRGTSPQGETRDMREKTERHILQVPFRRFPPLVAGATTFPPQAGALWVLSHGAMSLQESVETYSAP